MTFQVNGIEHLARELAGQFFEQKRSDRFRSKNSRTRVKYFERDPNNGVLVEKMKVMGFFDAYPTPEKFADGHWPLFYDAARKCYVAMLAMPDERISPHMKEEISRQLILDRQREHALGGKRLLQRAPDV